MGKITMTNCTRFRLENALHDVLRRLGANADESALALAVDTASVELRQLSLSLDDARPLKSTFDSYPEEVAEFVETNESCA